MLSVPLSVLEFLFPPFFSVIEGEEKEEGEEEEEEETVLTEEGVELALLMDLSFPPLFPSIESKEAFGELIDRVKDVSFIDIFSLSDD